MSGKHGEAHYVHKDKKRGYNFTCQSDKEDKDKTKSRSKSCGRSKMQCSYCDKPGHLKKNCFQQKRKKGKEKVTDTQRRRRRKYTQFLMMTTKMCLHCKALYLHSCW